jgi:hypothetical protein
MLMLDLQMHVSAYLSSSMGFYQLPLSFFIPSFDQGAWVLLTECDYVWMKPLPAPGDAYSSDVPGWQYHFGYIIAQHPGHFV